jgi:hypothetical protein
MYIRSTGLGKTLLKARVSKIESTDIVPSTLDHPRDHKEPFRLLMVTDVIEPVNWTVRIFVEPADLKHIVWEVLTHPATLLRALRFLFAKDNGQAAQAEGCIDKA